MHCRWKANQTDSPLLRLPSNIRQCIYEYALGGKTIRVGYVNYATLDMPNGIRSSTPVFRYRSIVYDGRCNLYVRRAEISNYTRGMSLLNGVCRQLYHETYTLPYSLNHFGFDSANALFNFIVMEERLARQQRNAITAITTMNQLPVPILLKKLPNLNCVCLMRPENEYEQGWWRVDRSGTEPVYMQEHPRYGNLPRGGFLGWNRK